MGIKSKLLLSYLILIMFSLSILFCFIGKKSEEIVFNEVTEKSEHITELITNSVSSRNSFVLEKIQTDLSLSEELLNKLGDINLSTSNPTIINGTSFPSLYAGNTKLCLDYKFVDSIKTATGQICSIFLLDSNSLIRISTNIIKDNVRPLGTVINSDSEVYKKIISNEIYLGMNFVQGDWYITGYKPLLDKSNKVIGALGIGSKQLKPDLEKFLLDTKVGKTGYVYIMDSTGTLIVHPNNKGQNLSYADFTQKIIKGKKGIIEYEHDGIQKLASYNYFEPWDWYIVTTANYDDLKSSSNQISNIILSTGAIILFLGVTFSLIMSNQLLKPLDKLKNCIEIAAKGDLTVHCDIDSNDEIGILSDKFNYMIKENKNLLEQVVQYDKLKTEFIANVSHELKTPLNIIFSTSQLFSLNLKNNNLSHESLSKYIGILNQNCYRLIRLVNNLIDITKIDSGFMKLNLKNQNIVDVIENITLSTAQYVKNSSKTIIFDTDVEEKIMAFDAETMERILLNLISNAIKFTNPGDTIEVSIYDKQDKVLISVKDSGIGIPKDNQEKIFERFKQVDPLLSRRSEGSGIGLSMVKSLVELHNGTITLKSNVNEGSEFIIELPTKVIDEKITCELPENYDHGFVEKIKIEFSDIYI